MAHAARMPGQQARLDEQWQSALPVDEVRELRAAASGQDPGGHRTGSRPATDLASRAAWSQGERAGADAQWRQHPSQPRAWLAEVRLAARARPVEANLTRGAEGYQAPSSWPCQGHREKEGAIDPHAAGPSRAVLAWAAIGTLVGGSIALLAFVRGRLADAVGRTSSGVDSARRGGVFGDWQCGAGVYSPAAATAAMPWPCLAGCRKPRPRLRPSPGLELKVSHACCLNWEKVRCA